MRAITVLAFGAVTDITGKNSFAVHDVKNTTELKAKLEAAYPALKNISYAIAVNRQMVSVPTALEAGATVALLPPFSGG